MLHNTGFYYNNDKYYDVQTNQEVPRQTVIQHIAKYIISNKQ